MLRFDKDSFWGDKSSTILAEKISDSPQNRSTQSAIKSFQSLDDDQLKSQSNLSRFFGVASVLTISYGFFSGKRIFTVIGLVVFSISGLALFAFRKELERRAVEETPSAIRKPEVDTELEQALQAIVAAELEEAQKLSFAEAEKPALNTCLAISCSLIARIGAFSQAKETLYQELRKIGTIDLINKKFTLTNANRRTHLQFYNTLRTFISTNDLETGDGWKQLSVPPDNASQNQAPISFNAPLLKEVLTTRTDTHQQDSAILDRYDGIIEGVLNAMRAPTDDLFSHHSSALGKDREDYISGVLSGIETFHQYLGALQPVLSKIEPT